MWTKSALKSLVLHPGAPFVLGIAICLQGPSAGVAGEAASWSFKMHPHPEVQELTVEEMALRDGIDFELYDHVYPKCLDTVAVDYAIYRGRYPAFSDPGDPEANFLAWKRHIVSELYPEFSLCIGALPYYALLYHMDELDDISIVFCGRFKGEPRNELDRLFKSRTEEALSFALDGNRSIGYRYFVLSLAHRAMRLNPDVEYYFLRILQSNDEYGPKEWDTSHLDGKLTPGRRTFVENAVQRRDLQAVLDTTAECAVQ